MLSDDARKYATQSVDSGVWCYQFDDEMCSPMSNDPDELRAIIGGLRWELDVRERRKPWWRFW